MVEVPGMARGLNGRGQRVADERMNSSAKKKLYSNRGGGIVSEDGTVTNPMHLLGGDRFSNSTASLKNVAIGHIENFTKRQFNILTEAEIATEEFFKNFGNYLAFTARTKELFDLGTVESYLSGAKEEVKKRFPTNTIWILDGKKDPTYWYTKLKRDLLLKLLSKLTKRPR